MKSPMVSRGKEILKIRAEINAEEAKETIAKINKAKSGIKEVIKSLPQRKAQDHLDSLVTSTKHLKK